MSDLGRQTGRHNLHACCAAGGTPPTGHAIGHHPPSRNPGGAVPAAAYGIIGLLLNIALLPGMWTQDDVPAPIRYLAGASPARLGRQDRRRRETTPGRAVDERPGRSES